MSVVAWLVVGLWGVIFLASARVALRRLPDPSPVVPSYGLWLPEGGEAPALVPPPQVVIRGATVPEDAPSRLLVLGAGVSTDLHLPGRLAACGGDFVSVFPIPHGSALGLARERVGRDVAGVDQVLDPQHPAGYADERCAWLRRRDLALPGVGAAPVLRVARARKAHGLPVDLRDGRGRPRPGGEGPPVVRAMALGAERFARHVPDMVGGDGAIRLVLATLPLVLVLTPLALLLSPAARPAALLALGLGVAARGMTALRDGFGARLLLLGPLLEPKVALEIWRAPQGPAGPPFPALPEAAPQALTGASDVASGRWLERAAVPFLARRLGGAAAVMEQIYRNTPIGRDRLGRAIDRAAHASPGARAVRHRWVMTVETARALAPRRLLSVPCGGARDAAAIGAAETVLVDPDPHARALARAACPDATVLDGTLEDLPAGPFDVILFVGLAEYLDDRTVVVGMEALRARLAPHGVLLCTTTADHPDIARMRRTLGWDTRARAPDDLARLLEMAGFREEARRADPLGIQWVFVARPVAGPPGPRAGSGRDGGDLLGVVEQIP